MILELVRITNNNGNTVYYITEEGRMNKSRVYNHLDEAISEFNKMTNEWSKGEMKVLMRAEV